MESAASTESALERNFRVIQQAIDYLSLNSEDKEKILVLVEKKSQENNQISVTEIFREQNLISEEEMAYLEIFDIHLDTCQLDQQFGILAVANDMASNQQIQSALKYQKDYFEKYRINIEIGEILVEDKIISKTDRIAILLTQNRVRDELLFDALNDIGETLAQRDAVNKRFGVMAIKNKLATIEQVNEALNIREVEQKEIHKPRFVGEILKEIVNISDEDINQVLQEQKAFEKRRFGLEKALYSIKCEIKVSKRLNKYFDYTLSRDGSQLTVRKTSEAELDITTYEFLIWLKRIGVKTGIVNDLLIENFIRNAQKNSTLVAAKGFLPEACADESIEFYFENEFTRSQETEETREIESEDKTEESAQTEKKDSAEPDESDGEDKNAETDLSEEPENDQDELSEKENNESEKSGESDSDENEKNIKDDSNGVEKTEQMEKSEFDKAPVDNEYSDNPAAELVAVIKKGGLLAKVVPGKNGRSGKDVMGNPIKPLSPAQCMFKAGKGVLQKGAVFVAQIDGKPMLQDHTIMVEPVEQQSAVEKILGNISIDTQDTYKTAKMEVKGNVKTEAVLRCHSLLLHGDLSGYVIATGDIEVKGEVAAENKPAETEESVNETCILSQGTVRTSKTINGSKIHAAGEIIGPHSTVIGSDLIACKGMTLNEVISDDEKTSRLQFGLEPGDKLIAINRTLGIKKNELTVLKREDELEALTNEYNEELSEATEHQIKQEIYGNIIEMIEAPELYQYVGLGDKIKYLYGLPDYSSIKAAYLKLPENDPGITIFRQIRDKSEKVGLEDLLSDLKNKIDSESEDEDASTPIERIKSEFKTKTNALKSEINENLEEIQTLEKDIRQLQTLREKLVYTYMKTIAHSKAEIFVKGKCEKGTIIKGKVAQIVLESTIYNTTFKEGIDPRTRKAVIDFD